MPQGIKPWPYFKSLWLAQQVRRPASSTTATRTIMDHGKPFRRRVVQRRCSIRRPVSAAAVLGLVSLTLFMVPRWSLADVGNHQCWDCLKQLAMQFPEKNPQEDPSFQDELSVTSAVGAFSKCSLDDAEIPMLRQIIGVFSDAQLQKDGVGYVREHLKAISALSDEDRAKLVDGARQDLGTTLGFITNRNCRILFQSQFDTGANRAWLLRVVQAARA